MKNKIFSVFLAVSIGILGLYAFKGEVATESKVFTDNHGVTYEAPPSFVNFATYPVPSDTITNAEIDTAAIPIALVSAYSYSIHATLATLSGTRSLKIYLDESNVTSGTTGWFTVDSISSSTTTNEFLMKGANVWGRKHRLRIKGSGTQSLKYTITTVYKRTNP